MELFQAIDVEEAGEVYGKNIRQFVMAEWDRLMLCCSNDLPVTVLRNPLMAVLNCASVVKTHLQWESLIFHAARPVYTNIVFLKLFKATINVFTAGKFYILKILLIVLCNEGHHPERQSFPKLLHF